MKFRTILSVLVSIFILFTGCSKDDENDNVNVDVKTTGELEFKTTNPMADGGKSTLALTSSTSNPQLMGDSTVTHTTSFKLCVGMCGSQLVK